MVFAEFLENSAVVLFAHVLQLRRSKWREVVIVQTLTGHRVVHNRVYFELYGLDIV